MQLTQYALDYALVNITAAGRVFDPTKCFVGLYQSVVNNGLATTLANITKATGSISNQQEITTWSALYHSKNQLDAVDGPIMKWSIATVADSQTVTGFYITDANGGGDLLGFVPLAAPMDFTDPQQSLSIVVRLTLDPKGTWDASMEWDD